MTAQRWVNPDSRRYYEARVLQNLFGQWEVQRAWGRIGSALGALRRDPYPSPEACSQALQEIGKRRAARGYR